MPNQVLPLKYVVLGLIGEMEFDRVRVWSYLMTAPYWCVIKVHVIGRVLQLAASMIAIKCWGLHLDEVKIWLSTSARFQILMYWRKWSGSHVVGPCTLIQYWPRSIYKLDRHQYDISALLSNYSNKPELIIYGLDISHYNSTVVVTRTNRDFNETKFICNVMFPNYETLQCHLTLSRWAP